MSEYTSNPSEYVRPSQQRSEGKLPTLTYETFEAPQSYGFDGDIHTHDVVYEDGSVVEIVFRRDMDMTVDISVHSGDDDVRTSNKLYDALEEHFWLYTHQVGEPSDFHPDVRFVHLEGTQDNSNPDDAVHGKRFRIELEYNRLLSIKNIDTIGDILIKLKEKETFPDGLKRQSEFALTKFGETVFAFEDYPYDVDEDELIETVKVNTDKF